MSDTAMIMEVVTKSDPIFKQEELKSHLMKFKYLYRMTLDVRFV
jgi:exopolyphosphatase/guanosine-5'-triphosphate,3'-diphosphate pyrophosphatase